MSPPVTLLLSMIAGWMNRKQQAVIDYLLEENRTLKDQLQGRALSTAWNTWEAC